MPQKTNYELKTFALDMLEIKIEDWNRLTPTERKTKYHSRIMKQILNNHPDRHANLDQKSDQFKQFVEITQCLTSLKYEERIVPDNGFFEEQKTYEDAAAQDFADFFESQFRKNERERNERSQETRVATFKMPTSKEELITNINASGKDFFAPTKERTAYYETVKELIPSLLEWTDWGKIDRNGVGDDFSWVINVIGTKFFLKHYPGIDALTAALVSKNNARVKHAFDNMVNLIKSQFSIFNFFKSTESKLVEFVDKFCQFEPDPVSKFFVGILPDMVLYICQSLSLALPYHLMDGYDDLDKELIRMLLTNYVKTGSTVLQLEAGIGSNEEPMTDNNAVIISHSSTQLG